MSPFLGDPSSPERKDAETLGHALFNNETPQQWADLYAINTFSIFFVTTAFLGLLDKGSLDVEGFSSSVINITSICGITKLAQTHVRPTQPRIPSSLLTLCAFLVCIQQCQGRSVAFDEDDGNRICAQRGKRACQRDRARRVFVGDDARPRWSRYGRQGRNRDNSSARQKDWNVRRSTFLINTVVLMKYSCFLARARWLEQWFILHLWPEGIQMARKLSSMAVLLQSTQPLDDENIFWQ